LKIYLYKLPKSIV